MDSREYDGWNDSDDDDGAGGEQTFYSDGMSIPSTPESIASQNAIQRPQWWQNVPVETRNAVREAETFIARNPGRRHDVVNDYVIWDDYRECLTAAVHRVSLSREGSAARKSAVSYMPVQVFSRSPSDSTDFAEDELELDLDDGQTEPDHNPDPGSATHSRPIGRIAILEINDSSSSPDSAKPVPVSQRGVDSQSKNTCSGYAINILSDSDLESSPIPVHLGLPKFQSGFQKKSVPDISSPRIQPQPVPQSHHQNKLPSTPDPKLATRTDGRGISSDESPMFISPIGALDIINKYPARNMKKVGQSTSLVEQPESGLRDSKIARKSAPSVRPDPSTVTTKTHKRRREEDQLGPDSRASKIARKTASSSRPEPSRINEDSSNRRKTFGPTTYIFSSSSESSGQEQLSRKRSERNRNIGNRGNIGIRTGRKIQASESSISSEEPPEIMEAREKVRVANQLKSKKKKAKKEGALPDAAHQADQPREKLYAPRKVLEEKGLRKIAISEGVHVTYDKEKDYHRHDKHIRAINTTNKPASPVVQVERTFEDRERSVSSSPEPEMTTPSNELPESPSPMPSRQRSRNETRQTRAMPQRSWFNRQRQERSQYQPQPHPRSLSRPLSNRPLDSPQYSRANPPPPPSRLPPVAPHVLRSQQQQQTSSGITNRRQEGLPPAGPRHSQVHHHRSSITSHAQQPATRRPSQHSPRQFSSTQSRHPSYSASQTQHATSSHHSHKTASSRTPAPIEDEEFQELKKKIRAESENHFWMKY